MDADDFFINIFAHHYTSKEKKTRVDKTHTFFIRGVFFSVGILTIYTIADGCVSQLSLLLYTSV